MQPSNIEIRAYSNPAAAGYVNFAALVPADATGAVDWFVDQAYVTSNGLSGANGLLTVINLNITPAGDHLVTAVYRGDANYLPSSAVVAQTAT